MRAFANTGKLVTAAIGIGAIVFALADVKVVFWAVVFAQTGLASAFGPPVICAIYYKGMTKEGALAGMLGGFLDVGSLEHLDETLLLQPHRRRARDDRRLRINLPG